MVDDVRKPDTLGRLARTMGIGTLICGVVAGLFWLRFDGTWYGALPALGVPLGLAAIVVGIVAIITKRGRRAATLGIVLAIVSPPLTLILQVAVYLIAAAWL